MTKKKHIVHLSGGRNSTAMLLRMIELEYKIDEIKYFSSGPWEWDEVETHIYKLQDYINRKITILHPQKDFDFLFAKKEISKGIRTGQQGYGWPSWINRWCTGEKIKALQKNIDPRNTLLYIGLSTDTAHRQKHFVKHKVLTKFPLISWGYNNKKSLQYCLKKGFNWNNLYIQLKDIRCWCCPFQTIKSLRTLRKHYPSKWRVLHQMDHRSSRCFKPENKTIRSFDRRFTLEDKRKK